MLVRLVLAATLLSGCGDQCHDGESQCEGNQIWTCDEGDVGGRDFRGLGECCAPGTCRNEIVGSDRVAVCSTTSAPDPRCPMFGTVCADSTTLLSCAYGYSEVNETCTGVCVDHNDGSAFCAATASDVHCADVPNYKMTCDGNTLLLCNEGAIVQQTTCTDVCVALSHDAFCSTQATPDPQCTSQVAWCTGNVAMTCLPSGYVDVETCDVNAPCTVAMLPDGTVLDAFCNDPGTPAGPGCYRD